MLRSNLSTRPFYNERAVRTGLGGVALIALGLTLFNAIEILRLESAGREARQLVAQNAAQAREMRDKAQAIRQAIDRSQLALVQAAAREANILIDRRTFSWTALLNYFQATLPPDVRIAAVQPQVENDGRMIVNITALARQIDDLNEFMDALGTTGAFTDVLSRSHTVLEDGTWRSELQAYYHVPPDGAAGGAPAASEPGRAAPANVSAGTATVAREPQDRPELRRGTGGER
jgi:Tfp pilus assembly protein PilN